MTEGAMTTATVPQRYFRVRIDHNAALTTYLPLNVVQNGEHSIFFPPFGEQFIVLSGDPNEYSIQCSRFGGRSETSLSASVELSAAITVLDLSHWLYKRGSRLDTTRTCHQLRVDHRLSTEELAANLHAIYLNHLRRPDAAFELRCRKTTRGIPCDDLVTLVESCCSLHAMAAEQGVIGSGQGQPVDIIIPTYGQPVYTLRCIASVLKDLLISRDSINHHLDVKIQVVDDAHPNQDGHHILQRLANQGCITFEINPTNLGFLESCNQAVARSRPNGFIVLLNNDIEVLPGWLLGLTDTLQQEPHVGLVGSKLIYPDGRLQEAGGIVWRDASAWNLGRLKQPDHPDFNYARSADYISGASIMLKRDTWDAIGGFDRQFRPAYYEDTDLALTIRDQGMKVIYQPTSQAIHHEGISCGTDLNQGIKAYQTANQLKFLEKWRERLSTHEPNGESLQRAKHRGSIGQILVIENLLLDPEGDAGSLFMMNYCLALQELGYVIHYVPIDNFCYMEDKALMMGARGLKVLAYPEIQSLDDIFQKHNLQFDLILLARPGNYQHLEKLRELAPNVPISYFTHDLHFLRTQRTAENLEDPTEKKKIIRKSDRLKQLETDLFKSVDLVLHISEEENQIAQELHSHNSVVLPPVVSSAPHHSSKNRPDRDPIRILFVGNFAHAPNLSAAQWLVDQIWPRVMDQRPDLQLLIAGKNPPETLVNKPNVEVLGYVDDLSALLNSVHLGIAPLLEGAGVKGKVLSALAHGLPMLTTSIGAEGIVNPDRQCAAVRVADSAEAFAESLVELCSLSSEEWEQLSALGRSFIADHFGPPTLITSFKTMLDQLQLPYHSHILDFSPYQPRSNDLRFNQNNSFFHWSHPLA